MRKRNSVSIMDGFDTLEDPRVDRCKRHHLLDIIAIALQSAPSSAGPTPGFTSNCSARARKSRSALSWNCPTASRPTTTSATSSPGWIRSSSSGASLPEPGAWTQAESDLVHGKVAANDGKTLRLSPERATGSLTGRPLTHLVAVPALLESWLPGLQGEGVWQSGT